MAMSEDQDNELRFYVCYECGSRRTTQCFCQHGAEMSLEAFHFNIVNGILYLKSQKVVNW